MRVSIIYGALRSGTTLLRLMLQGHPRLWIPGESDFLFDHLRPSADGFALDRAGLEHDPIRLEDLSELPETDDPVECVKEMVESLAEGRDHITLVLHRGIGKAIQVFPDAPIVHLVRDPRDVARSCVGMGWDGTAYRGVRHWLGTEREWAATAPEIPSQQQIEVRYEDLISSPEEHLAAIATLLGVEYDQRFHDYPSQSTYSKVDASLAYRWKRKMPPREAQLIDGRVGEFLAAYGYESSDGGAARPGGMESCMLAYRDFVRRWAGRFQRFGIIDPILSSCSRRLGLDCLAKGANSRIREKLNSLRK